MTCRGWQSVEARGMLVVAPDVSTLTRGMPRVTYLGLPWRLPWALPRILTWALPWSLPWLVPWAATAFRDMPWQPVEARGMPVVAPGACTVSRGVSAGSPWNAVEDTRRMMWLAMGLPRRAAKKFENVHPSHKRLTYPEQSAEMEISIP